MKGTTKYRTVKVPGGYATMRGAFYIGGLGTEAEADERTDELNAAYSAGLSAARAEAERLEQERDAARDEAHRLTRHLAGPCPLVQQMRVWAAPSMNGEVTLKTAVVGDWMQVAEALVVSLAESRAEAGAMREANARLAAVVGDMLSGFRYVRQGQADGVDNPWYGFGIDRLEANGIAALAGKDKEER